MATEVVKPTTELSPPLAMDEPSNGLVVAEKKSEVAMPPAQDKAEDLCKALVVARTLSVAHVEKEKKLSFIKAWEESEKSKVGNKAQKKLSAVDSWESIKKAEIDNKLRRFEEELEKKKAAYAEQMKNKAALYHKQAEEKRALVVAVRDEELLKVEELATKYRTIGSLPKKPPLGCLG